MKLCYQWFLRQIILRKRFILFLGIAGLVILCIVLGTRKFSNFSFVELENIDLPASESFSCPESIVPGACVVVITSQYTPRWICTKYFSQCAGYVYNSGTKEASFKKSFGGSPKFAPGFVVVMKNKYVTELSPHLEMEECAAESSREQGIQSSPQSEMSCKLANLDPWDPAIMKLIQNKDELKCKGSVVTSLEHSSLLIQDKEVSEVRYKTIKPKPNDDYGYTYGKTGTLTPGNKIQIEDDFVLVESHDKNGEKQVNFHAKVQPKADVVTRQGAAKPGLPLNILLVGFDSTSHAHFARKLPGIYNYLKKDLGSYIFKGYGIVGDGTTPALTAMLAGDKEIDLPEAIRSQPGAECVDRWPFIFPALKKHGYATLYSEDQATYGTFWYRLLGFCEPPVDHYGRPFWLAVKNVQGDEGLGCIGAEPGYRKRFNYIKSFYEGYPNKLKFSLSFFCIGHDDFNAIGMVEKDLKRLLVFLQDGGFLNDTMLVIFGDHGTRYGAIRSTMVGKLEERLPFLSISLPSWFRQKYPDIAKNLKTNTERLTTPFDLHATMKHMLSFPEKISTKYGKSLFEEVEKSRTCAKAGVPEHFCSCMNWKVVNTSHHHVQKIAEVAVKEINGLIAAKELQDKCSSLTLLHVLSAVKVVGGDEFQTFHNSADLHGRVVEKGERPKGTCHYQLQINTSPNDGIYEVTGHVANKVATVNLEMSRLDQYGKQPHCIMDTHPLMRKFCYCRSQ